MRCLPIYPPRASGFSEEEVTVGQLLKPFSSHSHIKLTAFQLIPISHLGALIGVEAKKQAQSEKCHRFHHMFYNIFQTLTDS